MQRPTRLAVFVLSLFLLLPAIVAAQDLDSAPITVDPVAAALSADASEGCDDIGRAVLFDDLDDPEFNVARAMACHRGVGATLMGVCTLPLTDTAILKGQIELAAKEAFVLCNVAVIAVGTSQVFVLPDQFSLLTSGDVVYPPVEGFTGTEVELDPNCNTPQGVVDSGGGLCADYPNPAGSLDFRVFRAETLTPKGRGEGLDSITGTLVFKVQTPMAVPFLLAWEPGQQSDPNMVVIANDRFLDPDDIP